MKKIFSIIVILGISISAMAQMKFGIKAGGNAFQLSGVDAGDRHGTAGGSTFAYGFHAGGYANYSFTHLFGIQAEAIYSMQGGKYSSPATGTKGIHHANYLNIPVLLEIKPFKTPFSFLVGPQAGYCVDRFYDGYGYNFVKDRYKNFDFAIAFGAQYALTNHLILGLRFNLGLTPSSKFNSTSTVDNQAIGTMTAVGERNRVLQLSVGWTF